MKPGDRVYVTRLSGERAEAEVVGVFVRVRVPIDGRSYVRDVPVDEVELVPVTLDLFVAAEGA